MPDRAPAVGRQRLSIGATIALVALVALNLRAALPNSGLIHGLGHWVGSIVLEGALVVALYRRRLPAELIGFQAVGWAYLAGRASDRAPGTYWWEVMLADWMVRTEDGLRGVSWGLDRWYVLEFHARSMQLFMMLLLAAVGGLAFRRLSIAARWSDRVSTLRPPDGVHA
jgi:hypothetical protein